jgi:hypothetical protein
MGPVELSAAELRRLADHDFQGSCQWRRGQNTTVLQGHTDDVRWRAALTTKCRDRDKNRQGVSSRSSGGRRRLSSQKVEDDRQERLELITRGRSSVGARRKARLLRAGDFAHLDIEHIADEAEDVGKAEQRELARRMAVLLAHLLKWRFQPQLRTKSCRDTIDIQRTSISRRVA